MSVSTAAMGAAELAQFLVASGTYSTIADAMAALNIVVVDEAVAAGTAIAVTGGPAELVVGTVGETALDVAAQATLQATGTNVTTASIGLLQGETAVTAAGILGVDVGIVAAAAAPLLGVALGANLYRSNPTLWTKISQKLLPFCYPGTTKIPTWAEIVGTAWETSIAKKIVDALKDLFEEENIPTYGGIIKTASSSLIEGSVEYANEIVFEKNNVRTTLTGTTLVRYDNKRVDYIGSMDQTRINVRTGEEISHTVYTADQEFTHDGRTVVWGGVQYAESTVTGAIYHGPATYHGSHSAAEVMWTTVYGDISGGGEYPEGTSEWDGNYPMEIPQTKPAVIGDGHGGTTTQPMVPISIPQEIPETWVPGQPVPSPDPETQPDPTKTTDPQTQVEPYVLPLPIPWETTETETEEETRPDPERDPTIPLPPTQVITDPPVDLGPDPIGISPWPALPTTPSPFPLDGSAGLITVYNPTPQELYAFESWLWVTLSQASVQTVWNNPFDGVIGLFELYCTPTINGRKTIRSAFLDSGVYADTVSRYTEIDCGTLGIPEYYGNYLDYSPYSKAHIYLPFIGIQELNVDDIVGHAVNVTYRIDEYNGSCIAMITVAKVTEVNGEEVEYSNTMYQFSGNCAVELPISGGNQSSILAGMMTANAYQQAAQISANAQMIGGIASIIGGVASLALGGVGGIGGIGSGISQLGQAQATSAFGQASALSNMLSGKSTVQKSGSFGSSHGALGIKTPFITITRPKQIQVPNYNELYGYPAHKMVTIGACTGFLRCREVHVVSPTATDAEKSIIESMLKSGVYITS